MKNTKKLFWIICGYFLLFVGTAKAQLLQSDASKSVKSNSDYFAVQSGFNIGYNVTTTVALIIDAFLGLLGVIFIILIILSGYRWMSAGGNEEQVTKAKTGIQRAIIGLIIIATAYAITAFVFQHLPGGNSGATGGPH